MEELATRGQTVVTTIVNVAETLAGGYAAGVPAESLKAREALLSTMPVLDLDAGAARQYAIWYSVLARRGEMVGAFDLLIASMAHSNGHSVVTRNREDFERIPGLVVEAY
jgi:tRNA(fMet)-specific endonuclease VapC